jgi:acyl carrier protein
MKTIDRLKQRLIDYYGHSEYDFRDSYLALNNDLGLDSLDQIELIQWVEDEFDIGINSYTAEELVTLHQLADYIDNTRCECITHVERKHCKRKNCNV